MRPATGNAPSVQLNFQSTVGVYVDPLGDSLSATPRPPAPPPEVIPTFEPLLGSMLRD